MAEVAILMAEGYEESETLLIVDMLRRAGIEVNTYSMTGEYWVTGMQKMVIKADRLFDYSTVSQCDMIVLPGGRPGGPNLIANPDVLRLANEFNQEEKYVTAMCFGTRVLPAAGIINGRKVTGYTGYAQYMEGAEFLEDVVVRDGNMITSQGPATVYPFAFALIEALGKDTTELKARLMYNFAGGK